MRCVWCGATVSEEQLDLNEHDEPAYCPVCGHTEFDNRPVAGALTTRFLKDTWKHHDSKEVEE